MSCLSETDIELIENLAISECYRNDAINKWETINDTKTPVTTYLPFAFASIGLTTYAFYKTKDRQIFIINLFYNKLVSYYNVNPTWYFLSEPHI